MHGIAQTDETNNIAEEELLCGFQNFAGYAENSFGKYPISYLELSRPTGKYASRLLLRELNLLLKRHSIVMVGNPCAPGYIFPKLEANKGIEQFHRSKKEVCGIFIANVTQLPENVSDAVIFPAEPFMKLTLRQEWNTFSDYLSAMSSKYRVRTKKALELSSKLTKRTVNANDLTDAEINDCAELLKHTLREKTLVMNKDLASVIRTFASQLSKQFYINLYYLNNSLVGFISYSEENNEITAWHLGYLAHLAKETHIYQKMLYDLVETGIEKQYGCVYFGRTATEIKSTLGAEPIENHFVVFIKNRILRNIVSFYKQKYFKPEPYTTRKPFK